MAQAVQQSGTRRTSNKWMRAFGIVLFLLCAGARAEVCNPAGLSGAYAVQLSGMTQISGTAKPFDSLGRLVFDGAGVLSGTSSTMFAGFLLGNLVTGSYKADWDCSVSWELQDDSGAYQHFRGRFSPDLSRGEFRQTDPGGLQRGVLRKIPARCTRADLRPKYRFTVSGSTTPMVEGQVARPVSGTGTFEVNDGVAVDQDCTVEFELRLLKKDTPPLTMRMRGVVTDGGKAILAIATDPGAMVAAELDSESK